MTEKHTPGPLTFPRMVDGSIIRDGIITSLLNESGDRAVANVYTAVRKTVNAEYGTGKRNICEPDPEGEANADRLLLAWNCHDELVDACEALLHHFCGSGEQTQSDAEVMGQARAAIALATEAKPIP